jgi:type I restriction enzyme, S subunit
MRTRWKETTIGKVVDFFDHKRIPLNSRERAKRKGTYPYYGASGVFDYIDGYLFDGQYLLIAEDGENLNSRKLPIAFLATGRFWVNNHAHIVRGKGGIAHDQFLKHWFAATDITAYVTGAAQPKLSQANLRIMKIALPEITDQRKIAAILSTYDNLIDNNTRRIQILEEMACQIYEEWFVRFRFPGHENVELVESELGLIPDGWEVDIVANAVERFPAGKKYDQKTVKPSGKVPVLDQGRSGVIGFHDDEPSMLATLDNPVIVFANHTCYQRLIYFPFSAIQNVIPFKSSDRYPRNIFWLHYATNGLVTFNDYKGHFPQFAAKQIVIPKDTLAEKFGLLIKPFLSETYCLSKKNENLRRTRDLLLPKLISGEIDVSNFPEPVTD